MVCFRVLPVSKIRFFSGWPKDGMVFGKHDTMVTSQKKIQHLYLRAGFGETPSVIRAHQDSSIAGVTGQLFASSENFKDLNFLPFPLNESQERKGAGSIQVLKMILKSKQDLEELNGEWIFKMVNTKAVLREKLSFFWHNHFATSVPFAYLMQVQNNTLRRLALGKFSDLLHAVAKDPAMLLYLNNQQNRKDHPNENFAREVMELFTLGIGHYSEKDVKEAARAFTGWAVNTRGEYEFHPQQHDDGEKEFLGRKGSFTGEDILNILLEEKQTARHLVTKIYREYVNPVIDKDRVEALAGEYFRSGYDTQALLRTIFLSEWFYDEENTGVKISSPVELIVRYKKLVGLHFKQEKTLLDLQKALGQVLFFPPNVAGWKGGANWIDSTSLLLRLSLPQAMLNGSPLGLKSKPAFEEPPEERINETEAAKTESDWNALADFFKNETPEKLPLLLLECFIQCNPRTVNADLINMANAGLSNENTIIREIANVMTLPEFQLI